MWVCKLNFFFFLFCLEEKIAYFFFTLEKQSAQHTHERAHRTTSTHAHRLSYRYSRAEVIVYCESNRFAAALFRARSLSVPRTTTITTVTTNDTHRLQKRSLIQREEENTAALLDARVFDFDDVCEQKERR